MTHQSQLQVLHESLFEIQKVKVTRNSLNFEARCRGQEATGSRPERTRWGILFGAARSRKWKEMFLALVYVKMLSNAVFRCAAARKLECPSNEKTYFALKPAN